jgi:protein O-mannosyl-transferase
MPMPKSIPTRAAATSPPDLPTWAALLVLALAVWAIYVRSLDAPWIFDDSISVLQNPSIRSVWPPVGDAEHPGPLRPPIENPMSARPLVNLSLAVNYHWGGLDPRGYRVVNVILHMANAMLLWAVAWRMLRLPYFTGRFDGSARWLALAVALVWAVHPLVTEAVVYVTQRTELMVAFCYLAAIYGSLRYWTARAATSRRAWLAVATLAGLAGAASKEVMVSAPVVVLLLDRTLVSSSLRAALRRSWPLYVGLASSWLVIAVLQLGTPRSESAGFGLGIPLVPWWSTQAEFFVTYLMLAVWPTPLVIHYELPQLDPLVIAWPSVVAVAALAAIALVILWRRQPAGWLLASVFLILAPTHLVPIAMEIAAERRMYLPLAALVALVVVGGFVLAGRVAPRGRTQKTLASWAAAILVVVATYAAVSVRRLEVFQDPVALWRQNVELQPYNHVAQMNLASALSTSGHPQDALAHYREAVRAKPDFVEGRYQYGLALAAAGQLDEAVRQLQEVVRNRPDAYKLRNNLGVVLYSAGRMPEAIAEFEKSLELEPDFAEARENLNRARQASVLPKQAE